MAHVEEDDLLQFTIGTMSEADAQVVRTHLSECEGCRKRQERLSSIAFARTMQPTPSKDGDNTNPDGPNAKASHTTLDRGQNLGRYVLIEKLGSGGMGEVFTAYDPHLDRKVAIKLLRSGSLSAEEGRARLLREAQALARLQHPNVIGVHDVGTFGDRVFIAMEFVSGGSLGDWLRTDRDWRTIVRVYAAAGRGLAAAHKAGLIHRDFKPDNVLVGEDDRPRVVDFGLARQATTTPGRPLEVKEVLDGDSTLSSQLTRDGAVMGTPGYMAPEQLGGLPTDARSDQFAFCVSLYEGLAGRRPFGGATLKQHADEIAAARILAPPATTRVPSRVWDVIKKGLSARPEDRWEDMDALLAALAVAQKRRGRIAVGSVLLAVLAVSGVGYAAWQQQRLKVCGGAEKRLAGLWDVQRKGALKAAFEGTKVSYAAEAWRSVERNLDTWALDWVHASRDACEAARIRKVDSEALYEMKAACLDERLVRFTALIDLLKQPDRDIVSNAAVAARSLDPVSSCLDASAVRRRTSVDQKDRQAEAAVRAAVAEARAYFDSGKYAEGARLLEPRIRADAPPAARAEALLWLGRLELRNAASAAAREANLRAAEQAIIAGEPSLEAVAFSRLHANEGYDSPTGDADDWQRLARAAQARVPDAWDVQAELAQNEAFTALRKRKYDDARRGFEQALALYEKHLGPEHPDVARMLVNLGVTMNSLGQLEAAQEDYERALAIHRAVQGEDHPNVATAENNLGSVLKRRGLYTQAAEHYENALRIRTASLGKRHPETLKTATFTASVFTSLGQHEKALALLQSTLATQRELTGENSVEVARVYEFLSELYRAGRYWKEAQHYAELQLEVLRQTVGETSEATGRAQYTLGQTHLNQGDWLEARRAFDAALRIRKQVGGDESNDVASVYNSLGDLAAAQRHWPEALQNFQKALSVREASGRGTNASLAGDLGGIGRATLALGDAEGAVAPLERALTLLEGTEETEVLAGTRFTLAKALWTQGDERQARAKVLLEQAWAGARDEGYRRDMAAFAAQQGVALQGRDGGAP